MPAYSPFYSGGYLDYPTTTTPIDAAALNHLESGVTAALPKDGSVAMTGALQVPSIGQLAGTATAGPLGVAGVLAEGGVTANTTGRFNLCSVTAPATGLYRVNGWFRNGNPGTATVAFKVDYTDGAVGAARAIPFWALSDAGIGTVLNYQVPGSGVTWSCQSLLVYAKVGTTLTVWFQDTTGSPADQAYGVIERLA